MPYCLVDEVVATSTSDPLEEVASLTVLHDDKHLLVLHCNGVTDLHHLLILHLSLNLNLTHMENS